MAKSDERRLELLQGTLDMLILRTLQWGPQHGHGIGQAIRSQSDELLKIETGTLYPALYRLEEKGWISASWTTSDKGKRARYYRLTARGRKQLVGERSKWDAFSRAMRLLLGPQEEGR